MRSVSDGEQGSRKSLESLDSPTLSIHAFHCQTAKPIDTVPMGVAECRIEKVARPVASGRY